MKIRRGFNENLNTLLVPLLILHSITSYTTLWLDYRPVFTESDEAQPEKAYLESER